MLEQNSDHGGDKTSPKNNSLNVTKNEKKKKKFR